MKPAWRWVIGGLVVVLLVLLVLGLAGTPGRGHLSPVFIELVRAKSVATGLLVYAIDHDGQLPPTLATLPHGAINPIAGRFHDPVTKEELDWIYYGGYMRTDNPSAQGPSGPIILASPRMVQSRQRIVLYADGSGALEDEDRFVQTLSKQLNDQRR